MPLFAYSCECGNVMKKFCRVVKDAPLYISCTKCQLEAKKILSAPSSVSKVVVDNGVQARAVEINPEIIEINKERANKDYRED